MIMTTAPAKPSPRVPIDTCEGLFEKLKWEYEQLQKAGRAEGWSNYSTFNFVITAYHLYHDWLKNAGTPEQQERKRNLPQKAKLLFRVLKDITNASKHWELDQRNQAVQTVSKVSTPMVADWYAYFVAGPVMYVTVGDARPSLPELASVTMKCFEWILLGPSPTFPLDLENDLATVFRPLRSQP